ncbi:MAG: zinc-ribbon domain-containing protein [Oscillospiraceae bacterium]|nr:zinc-ribbon domain-containing protein [Oscillospiraceae bacterium]
MYCSKCGKHLPDDAVFCVACGCAVGGQNVQKNNNQSFDSSIELNTLSQRLNTNGIIWLVIGVLQILGGLFVNWFLLIVGVLNIVSSFQDMKNSKRLLEKPNGIVAKFEPITGPVITLIYNLVIGGVIGVVGSIYYFVAIRNYVMENKQFFASLDAEDK